MKKILIAVAVVGSLAGAYVAQAQDATKKCMGCHDMDKKKAGPAFKDVAKKYKGNNEASGMVIAKMKDGKGHPKVAGTDAELKAAVDAALAAK